MTTEWIFPFVEIFYNKNIFWKKIILEVFIIDLQWQWSAVINANKRAALLWHVLKNREKVDYRSNVRFNFGIDISLIILKSHDNKTLMGVHNKIFLVNHHKSKD